MVASTLTHFDYLTEHDGDLERALGLSNLSKDIIYWRCTGMEYPEGPLVGCRKIVETSLKRLAAPLPDNRMRLQEIIDYAKEKDIIDKSIALKCHEIRVKGNQGAHTMSVKAIDAKMVLDLLDDYLRWCAESLKLIPAQSDCCDSPKDPIFIVKPREDMSELSSKARLAAALGNDKSIEKRARATKDHIESFTDSTQSDLQTIQDLIRQAEEKGVLGARKKDSQTLAAQQRLFEGFESKIDSIAAKKQALSDSFDELDIEIQEILTEHDFIRKLLGEGQQATLEQQNVMAFPRGSGAVTNVLQIAGGAGTGKTLCLVAKIIKETNEFKQQRLFGESGKKALFVCFNRGLANYVRSILNGYDNDLPDIEVVNYDLFVNQLVREKPRAEFSYLAEYAKDAKYPGDMIIYGYDGQFIELLRKAQLSVAERYPKRANEYYLNPENQEGFEWLTEELAWIDARFMSAKEASSDYPTVVRVGRGSKRSPSKAMRKIILEIWAEFNRLLESNQRYTIEQATKRLLASDNLPAFDAIAIDEVQDFSLSSIRLLLRLRRNENTKVFISGDENQKIYQRDFTWKELDEGLKGYTIRLQKNMRNSPAIRRFCDRLLGIDCPTEKAWKNIHIEYADDDRVVSLLRKLSDPSNCQTTALITSHIKDWEDVLRLAGIAISRSRPGDILNPGLYLIGDLMGKGLEFDNVVVDYTTENDEDEEAEKRLRYVHFTRARKRLYIRYLDPIPKLLNEYYSDFVIPF